MFEKRNSALSDNSGIGGQPDLQISVRGSDWYWTVCSIMGFSTIVFMGLAFRKHRSHRIFHYITASITMIATIAYYSMGADIGRTPIQVEYERGGGLGAAGTREIFYVRYIDWFVTTPLLLLDLLLTAGLPWPTIMVTILADEVMIVTGLVGALTRTSYKWGYYAFGCAALFYIVYTLGLTGRSNARALGSEVSRVYLMCGVTTIVVWMLYPIAWGVSEGGNVIHPDSEAIFYGILDIIAKPVFGAILLWGHRNINPADLGLHMHDYDEVSGRTKGNHPHSEKHDGVHNGASNGQNGHNGTTTTGPTETPTTTV